MLPLVVYDNPRGRMFPPMKPKNKKQYNEKIKRRKKFLEKIGKRKKRDQAEC